MQNDDRHEELNKAIAQAPAQGLSQDISNAREAFPSPTIPNKPVSTVEQRT